MSRCIRDLIIGVLLVLNGVVLVSLLFLAYPESKQGLRKAGQQNHSTQSAPASAVNTNIGSADVADNLEKEPPETYALTVFGERKSIKISDTWIIFLTAVIAIATIALYCEANERGKQELRAYLGVKDQVIRKLPTGKFQAVITVENCGKTPANNVRRILRVGARNINEADFDLTGLVGQMPMAPGFQWQTRKIIWEITDDDISQAAVKDSERRIFAWGRIEYEDVYKRSQFVNFRFMTREITASFTADGEMASLDGFGLHPTEDGNEAS
jgi:hypothetical protein